MPHQIKKWLIMAGMSLSTVSIGLGQDASAQHHMALNDLQNQIDALKAQIQTSESNDVASDQQANQSTQFGTHRGAAQSLFALDRQYTPFAKLPSSQVPLGVLMQRNNYHDGQVVIGGYVESIAQLWNNQNMQMQRAGSQTKDFPSGGGFALSNAKLYLMSNLGHYVQGFMTFQGQQSQDVHILEGFVNIGNLQESPFFMTFGKTRPSMGTYASGAPFMSGLTQGMFRPDYFTNATFGYQTAATGNVEQGVEISVFSPKSNGAPGNDLSSADFIISAGDSETIGPVSVSGLLGYVYDWRGTGMGATSGTVDGSAADVGALNRNGVINFDGQIGYHYSDQLNYGLGIGGATTTQTSQATNNERAGAWYVSGNVTPVIKGRPTHFGITYGHAYNTERLPMGLDAHDPSKGWATLGAQDEFLISASRNVFNDNFKVSLEYGYLGLHDEPGQKERYTNLATLMLATYF